MALQSLLHSLYFAFMKLTVLTPVAGQSTCKADVFDHFDWSPYSTISTKNPSTFIIMSF